MMNEGNNSSSMNFVHSNIEIELLPSWGYAVCACLLLIIFLIGFTSNTVVMILFIKCPKLVTPMNVIILNIVASDFLTCIFGSTVSLIASIHHGWYFGDAMCTINGYINAIMGITSIISLMILSYERYRIICCLRGIGSTSMRKALSIVFVIWIYSFGLTTPPLFGWGEYVLEGAHLSCSVDWETKTNGSTSYIMYLMFFGFIIPVSIIIYSYLRIALYIRRNARSFGQVKNAERKTALMIFLMISAFLFAWTPYAVFAMVKQFSDNDFITPAVATAPALLAKSSICYNPFIYVGMNTQVQGALRQLFKKDDNHVNHTANESFYSNNTDVKTQRKVRVELSEFPYQTELQDQDASTTNLHSSADNNVEEDGVHSSMVS